MKKKLGNYVKASFPCIVLETAEEARAAGEVLAAAKETGKSIITWSLTEGLRMISPQIREYPDTQEPQAAFQEREARAVYIFRDFTNLPFDRDPMLLRTFRDLLAWAPTAGSCVFVITPSFIPAPSIEKSCTVLSFPLPEKPALYAIAQALAQKYDLPFEGDAAEEVARAMQGLSTDEATNAVALAIVETGLLDVEVIHREKVLQVRKSKLLDLIDPDPAGLAAVGGMDVLKEFILQRKETYSERAVNYPLPPFKGILAVGPPGTGKSLIAKAIGIALGLKTLKLDFGSMFGSYVGESEQRLRDALKLAEALSPCVLWVDEIDKGLSGTGSSSSSDSGTTSRVYGTLLTWLQERKKPVFVVATANDVSGIDSAFLRKGRFDKVFSVDLPSSEERQEIFKIHLRKRKREKLAESLSMKPNNATPLFSGAEIEAVIEAAMFRGFFENRDITEQDLVDEANRTRPLAKMAPDQIKAIREWCRTKAEPATRQKETSTNQIRDIQTGKGGESNE